MGEQDNGRNHVGTSDERAVQGAASPTEEGSTGAPVRLRERRAGVGAALRARRAVQTVLNALAALARLVGSLFAVVLLVRIGLGFAAVNPHNVIVEWIVRFSDVIVLEFRDLFLPADPQLAVAVNYGLAAVFWLVAGLVVGALLSALGRLVGGEP
jgi:hypothetical protein